MKTPIRWVSASSPQVPPTPGAHRRTVSTGRDRIDFRIDSPARHLHVWCLSAGRMFPRPLHRLPGEPGRWTGSLEVPTGQAVSFAVVEDLPQARPGILATARLLLSARARDTAGARLRAAVNPSPPTARRIPAPVGNEGLTDPASDDTIRTWAGVVPALDAAEPDDAPGATASTDTVRARSGPPATAPVAITTSRGRTVCLWSTPGAGRTSPVVLVMDGEQFGWARGQWATAARAEPSRAAHVAFVHGLPDTDRMTDLADPRLPGELLDEVLPAVVSHAGLTDPHVITAGSSMGAVPAVTTALAAPERIHGVIALSGSFHWGPRRGSTRVGGPPAGRRSLERLLRSRSGRWTARVVLTHGILEDDGPGRRGLVGTTDAFAAAAREAGAEVLRTTVDGGHDLLGWLPALVDAVAWIEDGGPAPS